MAEAVAAGANADHQSWVEGCPVSGMKRWTGPMLTEVWRRESPGIGQFVPFADQ
jgi:hypothetical protein